MARVLGLNWVDFADSKIDKMPLGGGGGVHKHILDRNVPPRPNF